MTGCRRSRACVVLIAVWVVWSVGSVGVGRFVAASHAAAARAAPVLPIQHHGAHPGAAVLAGDIAHLTRTGVIPSLPAAAVDGPNYHGCLLDFAAHVPRYCMFGDVVSPHRTIAVVGDSVVGEWLGALEKVAVAHHWRIVGTFHSRCPWTATMTVNLGEARPYTACHDWGASVLHAMVSTYRPTVVITSERPVLGTTKLKPGPAASRAIGLGMVTYWRTLVAHHIGVVPIRESPEMGRNVVSCLRKHTVAQCSVTRRHAVPTTTPLMVATKALRKGVGMVDLTALMCRATMCRPIEGNVLLYRDVHHISQTYALTVAPYLERKLLRIKKLSTG